MAPNIFPFNIVSHSVSHMSTVYNSGCGKREAHKNWSMVVPEKAAPVTGTTLRSTGRVPADSRQ